MPELPQGPAPGARVITVQHISVCDICSAVKTAAATWVPGMDQFVYTPPDGWRIEHGLIICPTHVVETVIDGKTHP